MLYVRGCGAPRSTCDRGCEALDQGQRCSPIPMMAVRGLMGWRRNIPDWWLEERRQEE